MLRLISRMKIADGPVERVVRGAGSALFIKVVGAILAYLMEVILARWLGAEYYGQYTYVIAWVAIVALPATAGLHGSVLRFVPEHRANERWPLVKGVMLRSWQITITLGVVMALVAVGITILLLNSVGLQYGTLLLLGMSLVPFKAALNLQEGMGRGLGSVWMAFAPRKIIRPILIVTLLYGFRRVVGDITAGSAILATLLCLAVVGSGQGSVLWLALPKAVRNARAEFETRRWLRISLPLLLISGFMLILNRTDVIMLGVMSNAEEVGIYNAAAKTAAVVGFILAAVNALAAPTISRLWSQQRTRELQELATWIAHLSFWPSLGVAGMFIVFAELILGMFGAAFTAGSVVLMVLAFAQVVNAGMGSVGYMMNMTGHQDLSAKVFGISALVNIVSNLVAIPLFGTVGAAVATGASMLVWNIWLNRAVFDRMGIRTSFLSSFIR